ncbi:hypothetical protein GGP86_002490 [Salinibacter ruber]|nr:hypothetical protein [Salinibacter ruber]
MHEGTHMQERVRTHEDTDEHWHAHQCGTR